MAYYRRIAERHGDEPDVLTLPECGPLRHVVGWMFEAGPNAGDGALTWQEIDAWARATQTTPTASEAIAMRGLSSAYMSELHSARNPNRCRPLGDAVAENAQNLKMALRSMSNPND